MEIYELVRKHLAMVGIDISKTARKKSPINVKNVTFLILTALSASSTAYSMKFTDKFDERTDMANQSVSFVAVGVCYAIVIWKTSELKKFMMNLTEAIKASE